MKLLPGSLSAGAALALACLATLPAAAQEKPVTTSRQSDQTLRVSVSGRTTLDYVYRSSEMTAFTDSVGGGGPNGSDSETTFEGFAAVRLDVELSDKMSVVLEMGTRRVDAGSINEWGNAAADAIQLREARMRFAECPAPSLTAEAGISTWSFDVRGRGSSLFMDPRHAQPASRNLRGNSSQTTSRQSVAAAGVGDPDELQPVGLWVRYVQDVLAVDLVALPAAVEGGSPSDDESIYAVNLLYGLPMAGKDSRIGFIAAITTLGDAAPISPGLPEFSGSGSRIVTIGGGIVLRGPGGVEGLELYAEGYFQSGDAGKYDPDGSAGALPETDAEAAGRAFQAGAEYRHTVGNPMPVWVGVNYTQVSGDDDTSIGDDEINRFLGYESVNDLLILEDMYFGFDIDTNYTVLKVNGGIAFSVAGGRNNLEVEVWFGSARTSEDIFFGGAVGTEDELGNEIDVKAKLILGKQMTLRAGVAFVTGSDLLEQSMGGSANPDSDDAATLFVVGMDVRF